MKANTTYLLKTGNSSLDITYEELSGSGSGNYLPLAGGTMTGDAIVKWNSGGTNGGIRWFEPNNSTLMGELTSSKLMLSNPVLQIGDSQTILNSGKFELTLGLPQGQDLNWNYSTINIGVPSFTQTGNAFSVDYYGTIMARKDPLNYYTIDTSGGFNQVINSGQHELKLAPNTGLTLKMADAAITKIDYMSILAPGSLTIGDNTKTTVGISHNITGESSFNINSMVSHDTGKLISHVDNYFTTLPSAILGTDLNGKLVDNIKYNKRVVDATVEIYKDNTDSSVVAYNIILDNFEPLYIKPGVVINVDVFGILYEINKDLNNTTLQVGYNTSPTGGYINGNNIVMFLADSVNKSGGFVKSTQGLIKVDTNTSTDSGISNLSWKLQYTGISSATGQGIFNVIKSENNMFVKDNLGDTYKLVSQNTNEILHETQVLSNNTLLTNNIDRVSIGIFTGFVKMDIFTDPASGLCANWQNLTVNTMTVKARISVGYN